VLKRLRAEDGVAMVEFAIVLPVLLLVVFGIFYFGLFLNDSIDETHLASEAVRFAAVNVNPGSPSSIQSYVLQQASPDLQTNGHLYLYYPTGSTGLPGSSVRACVTAPFQFVPLLGVANTQVTETATMRVEQAPSNWVPDSTVPSQCPKS
jgi:Flp pilus assembly protein TadG